MMLGLAFLAGCSDSSTGLTSLDGARATGLAESFSTDSSGTDDGAIAAPGNIVLSVGQTVTLQTSNRSRGRTIKAITPTWRSSDPAVVTTGTNGTVTGVTNGGALVTASSTTSADTFRVVVGTGPEPLRFVGDSLVLPLAQTGTISVTDTRYPLVYTTLDPAIATVDDKGVVTAKSVGRTSVRATNLVGATGTFTVAVPAPAGAPVAGTPTTPPPPPPTGSRIVAKLTRFTTGTGAVLVSSAIPLAPGMLNPADAANVHVLVNGVEQRIYAEALKGTHPDGSLMTVLVQFPYTLSSTATVDGEIVIGGARTNGDLTRPTASRSIPEAVILPSDPAYLVSTNFLGPTMTKSEAGASAGALAAKYDNDFGPFADIFWTQSADAWGENYYDRAQAYYAQWLRTGNSNYWYRGTRHAMGYRVGYIEDAQYGTSPHWSQIDGLAEHYQLTGDEQSRYAVGRIAETLRYFRDRAGIEHPDIEGRILARTLMAQLWGWRLQARGAEAIATSSEIATLVTRILDRQSADGAWRFLNICAPSAGNLAYMDGMVDEALIQAYTHHQQNARIPTAVQKSTEFIWSQWDTGMQGVKYAPGCPAADYNVGVPELNNLMINAFAWTYAKSGSTVARQRGDSLFNAGVRHQFLYGSKQFNQQYSVSFRYFAYRTGKTY